MEEGKHPECSLLCPSFLFPIINQTQLEARQEGIPVAVLSVSLLGLRVDQRIIGTGSEGEAQEIITIGHNYASDFLTDQTTPR